MKAGRSTAEAIKGRTLECRGSARARHGRDTFPSHRHDGALAVGRRIAYNRSFVMRRRQAPEHTNK